MAPQAQSSVLGQAAKGGSECMSKFTVQLRKEHIAVVELEIEAEDELLAVAEALRLGKTSITVEWEVVEDHVYTTAAFLIPQ